MSTTHGRTAQFKLGAVALILVGVAVGALRPVARFSGHRHNRWEFGRVVFMAEPVADPQSPPISPVRVTVQFLAPVLISVLLMVLKARRLARSPVPIRRLKLPMHATTDSLLTD